MKKIYQRSLYIFRRDLRLHDNTVLGEAGRLSKEVIPCFIFDPRQIGEENEYKSMPALQFMSESLKELHASLVPLSGELYFFYGKAEEVVAALLDVVRCDAVFMGADYTPFSRMRDAAIQKVVAEKGRYFCMIDDLMINPPHRVVKKDGNPYLVFTPYHKAASVIAVAAPRHQEHTVYATINENELKRLSSYRKDISFLQTFIIFSTLKAKGGRSHACMLLDQLSTFADYEVTRDIPALATTGLSPHLKFGTISIREVYYAIVTALGQQHPLLRQLYWRDFFTMIAWHYPIVFGRSFHAEYDHLAWSSDQALFAAWCNGMTGFPLVDAGIRELKQTGFMHNRVRMVVASFLVKDLHGDWRKGEQFFARHLIDYDPAVNNGNWQWVASTGCDAQPYFRIFNPWLQQKKYDPECTYIKRWIPELRSVPVKEIHSWERSSICLKNYPKPIVSHAKESEIAKNLYKKAKMYR